MSSSEWAACSRRLWRVRAVWFQCKESVDWSQPASGALTLRTQWVQSRQIPAVLGTRSPAGRPAHSPTIMQPVCKHPKVRVVAREDDVEYVECEECGEVFDADEYQEIITQDSLEDVPLEGDEA